MSTYLIFVILLFVAILILGLYDYDTISVNNNNGSYYIYSSDRNIENFGPLKSSMTDVDSGSSTYYKWGLKNNSNKNIVVRKESKKESKKDKCRKHKKNEPCNIYCFQEQNQQKPVNCRTCDITQNKDIDKYVLKSSVPPCPDLSKYATKNMMCPTIDTSKYILKSEVKPCPKIDMSKYIKKSDIPPCPDCPKCPKCPVCPVCPKQQKCKKIYEYNITEHPEFKKYISRDECNKTTQAMISNDYNKEEQSQTQLEEEGNKSSILNPQINNDLSQSYNLGNGMYAKFQSCSPIGS